MNPAKGWGTKASFLSVIITITCSHPAAAQSTPLQCAPTENVDKDRLLRQLTLDLLGRIPTIDELAAASAVDELDDKFLETMLQSDEYFAQVRAYHRTLLWSTLKGVPFLLNRGQILRRFGPQIYYSNNNQAQRKFRGRGGLQCLNRLQPDDLYDATGYPLPIETIADDRCPDGICRQEGYVHVEPYWAPGTEIKVCAYDAQALSIGKNGQACAFTNNDPGCGCGPNLRECTPSFLVEQLLQSLAEEPIRLFEHLVREDRNYLDAFRHF